jgi:hypothetical protein
MSLLRTTRKSSMSLLKKTRESSKSSPKPMSRSQPFNRTMALQHKPTIKNPITTRKTNSSNTNRKRLPLTNRRLLHTTSRSSLLKGEPRRPTLMINEQALADNEYT